MGDICKIVWFGDKGLVRAHVLVKILTPLSFFSLFSLLSGLGCYIKYHQSYLLPNKNLLLCH